MDDTRTTSWQRRRLLYYCALSAWFAAIAFYFGPNEIMFGKLTSLSPADFVPDIERRCVVPVRAMKIYQRDHGTLPSRVDDLVPDYLSEAEAKAVRGYIWKGKFEGWAYPGPYEWVSYNFDPADEGWYVHGAFTTGRIPMPPVIVGPSTKAATHPSR